MTKDEYDDIMNGVNKATQDRTHLVCVKKQFELIGGPLDGEIGTRYPFGIVIFGVLTIRMDDGQFLCGTMDMPRYFKYPYKTSTNYNKTMVYKFVGNMRYEFLEYAV